MRTKIVFATFLCIQAWGQDAPAQKPDDNPAAQSFFKRLIRAYLVDWRASSSPASSTSTSTSANPSAKSLLITGANGAYCKNAGDLTCYAPEWATINYVERQFSDYMSIRNEFFDDIVGQRTGFKTHYSEHLTASGHWIGTTVLIRPEFRCDHSYNTLAYNNGTKYSQLMLAGDFIFFF